MEKRQYGSTVVSFQRGKCRHRLPFEVGQHPAIPPSSPGSVAKSGIHLEAL